MRKRVESEINKDFADTSADSHGHNGNRSRMALPRTTKCLASIKWLWVLAANTLPVSMRVVLMALYPQAWAWSFVISYHFGAIMAVAFICIFNMPVVIIVYRAVKHEEQIQSVKYIDRWEGTEEKQREALEYLIKCKRKT